MLALDPPDGGATVGGIVASARLRPAALALRRRARPRGGNARGALRRHARQDRRQGDQERGRLRPGQAVRRLVRHARRDHRGGRAPAPASAVHRHGDRAHRGTPAMLAEAAAVLTHASIEHSGLDVRWEDGAGSVLARFGGAAPGPQAENAARLLREAGLDTDLAEEDDGLWSAQRDDQRARQGSSDTVVRVAGAADGPAASCSRPPTRHSALLVGRAPLALSWLRLEDPEAAPGRAPRPPPVSRAPWCSTRPPRCASGSTPWGERDAAVLALMRRVKDGFDPSRRLRAGGARVSAFDETRAAVARPDRRLRALRLLPAHLPHLPALGRGDGLPARADRADEAGPRARSPRRSWSTSTTAWAAWPA